MSDYSICKHDTAIGYCDICSPTWRDDIAKADLFDAVYARGIERGRKELEQENAELKRKLALAESAIADSQKQDFVAYVGDLACHHKYDSKMKLYASPIITDNKEKQPYPNHNWCVGCSPDNCQGCGTEPLERRKLDNERTKWMKEGYNACLKELSEQEAVLFAFIDANGEPYGVSTRGGASQHAFIYRPSAPKGD